MTPSENRPHAVARRGLGIGYILPTYPEAFRVWKKTTSVDDPYDIITVETGRVIDPGTPVIDVNE